MDPAIARGIAQCAHAGQRTRQGRLVADHVERVARAVPEHARAVALLHEVLEQSSTSTDALRQQGLTAVELDALRLLTRDASEAYEVHVLRIAHASGEAGALARTVKLADLDDHLGEPLAPAVGVPPYAWARRHIDFARHVRRETGVAA